MKKNYLLLLLIFSFRIAFSQIADISFSSNSWNVLPNVTTKVIYYPDSIVFIADSNNYLKVQLDVPVASSIVNVYFVAEVKLEGIVNGDLSFQRPKLKIYQGGTNTNIQAYNLTDVPEGKFYKTGMVIERYDKLGLTSLRLEFGMQNLKGGKLVIKHPELLSTPPVSNFSFPFSTSLPSTVSIDIDTTQKQLFNSDLLSANSHFTWASYKWSDTEVKEVINQNFPLANLRFPAGTVGNFYNYLTDGFHNDSYAQQNSSAVNGYNKGFTFDYAGYKDLCISSNASSTLMFNVISDDVNTSANRLQSRINDGLKVKFIEMGNENYYSGQNLGNVSSLSNYVNHTSALAAALKTVDPNVKVAVNIDHDDYSPGGWNSTLSQESYFDACVMHPYVQTNTFLLNELSGHKMMSAYKITKERIALFESNFPGKDLLFTEYSILSGNTPVNFVQTLSLADMFFAILEGSESGPVRQAGIHMFYHSDNYYEATLTYHNGTRMVLTANGIMYSSLFKAFKGGEVFSAKSQSTELESGLPAINARAIDQGDSIFLYAVNKLPQDVTCEIKFDGTIYQGPYQMSAFHEDVNVELTAPYTNYSSAWSVSSGNGVPIIHQYSITIIKLAKSDITNVLTSTNSSNQTGCFKYYPTEQRLSFSKNEIWEIFSLSGKLLSSGNSESINLSGYSSGVYLIRTKEGCVSKVSVD